MAKGKKSGAFLNQKKKAGSADFSNPKAKVGRKVKRRVGETDASFQTRQLSIGEQSIARQKKDGAKTSKRGLTCEEHLGQLGHHNDKARAAAAEGLADICAAHADEAWRLFGPLLDGAARLLGDAHRPCRRHALRLLQAGLASTRRAAVRAAAPLLAARLGAALSSFDGGCRGRREALELPRRPAATTTCAGRRGEPARPVADAAGQRRARRARARDHEAGKSAYRPTLLRVVAALFLADAPARKRGRRFSFAPEDDVLDVDDVAEGDDAIPGHRGVVLLRDVRRARPGDWRRREAAAAATATVADGEAAARVEDAASARRSSRAASPSSPRTRTAARSAVVDAVRRSPAHSAVPAAVARHLVGVVASPSSWPAAGALLYHLPLPLGDDVVSGRRRRGAPGGAPALAARGAGRGWRRRRVPRAGAAALLERSAAALRDGDAAAAFLAQRRRRRGGGALVAALATMVDGALARPGGDDAAARRSRQARVEYLCVSLCALRGVADGARALVAALALRRLAAAERSAGEGLGPAAAAAAGLLRDRPRQRGLCDVGAPSPGAVGDALPKCAALALAYAPRVAPGRRRAGGARAPREGRPAARGTSRCGTALRWRAGVSRRLRSISQLRHGLSPNDKMSVELKRAPPRRRRSSTMEAAPDGDAQKRVAPFLTKLSNLVESCPPEVGGWTPDGLSFLVNDEAITHQVLPNFFSHTNFRSFCRQLSCCARPHGFRKTRRRKLSAANGQCGWSEFSHAFFVRNRRDLLCQIKRMEHLSTSSSNGEPAEEQPTKRPRLPSVDDEHAAALSLREMAAPAGGGRPWARRRRRRLPGDGLAALTAAIASVPSPAGKATPSGLGRNSHNARPSFGDDARKSLPADVTIRPAAVPVTVNPPDTPADRRFSADIGRAWPATAPWSPDAVVHKPAAPPAAHFLAARVVSQAESEDDAPAAFPAPAPAPPKCEVLRLQQRVDTLEGLLKERDSFIQELFAKTHVVETPSVTPRQHQGPMDPFADPSAAAAQPPRAAAPYVPIAPRCVTEPGATHVAAV
ncbi:hypothetical protein JL720_10947 [Aureococcus anophagefferens]|nr:hypothetical protein JL720_10947 [Aureococcus anophagefferens]